MFLKFRYRMGYLPFCVASMVMGTACHRAPAGGSAGLSLDHPSSSVMLLVDRSEAGCLLRAAWLIGEISTRGRA